MITRYVLGFDGLTKEEVEAINARWEAGKDEWLCS